jgi:hypothetical protein
VIQYSTAGKLNSHNVRSLANAEIICLAFVSID